MGVQHDIQHCLLRCQRLGMVAELLREKRHLAEGECVVFASEGEDGGVRRLAACQLDSMLHL